MSRLGMMGLGLAVVAATSFGLGVAEPQQLQEALDGLAYAELLNAGHLTAEQLDALHAIQVRLQADGLVGPDLATVLRKVLEAVVGGMSVQQAQASLGPEQQVLEQAQQRWQQSLQQSADELRNLLTDEQKDALVWFGSPAHALDGVVDAVSQARAAPDPQWNQFKTQLSQAVSQMLAQAALGGAGTPEGIIGELLDQARALDDAAFKAKQASLAQAWLPTLMPKVAQMLEDPQFRQQQLAQVCQRLVAYGRAQIIVQAKRDAPAAP